MTFASLPTRSVMKEFR